VGIIPARAVAGMTLRLNVLPWSGVTPACSLRAHQAQLSNVYSNIRLSNISSNVYIVFIIVQWSHACGAELSAVNAGNGELAIAMTWKQGYGAAHG
jgi:hypothetical protein